MKKQENKKFGFEKFEVAKLNSLRKIQGGTANVNDIGNDDGDLTNMIQAMTSKVCAKKKIEIQEN